MARQSSVKTTAAGTGSRSRVAAKLTQSWNDSVLIGDSGSVHPVGMATITQKIEAERRMRAMLEDSGLPQPDIVEYDADCIRLFFNESKHVVVIDFDETEQPDDEAGVDVRAW